MKVYDDDERFASKYAKVLTFIVAIIIGCWIGVSCG